MTAGSATDVERAFADVRRRANKLKRAIKRGVRLSRWEHCGPRQRARYARQIAAGRLKIENGLAA